MNSLRRRAVFAAALAMAVGSASAADIVRTRQPGSEGVHVMVDNISFPAAVLGTKGSALEQVDEVVAGVNKALAARGLDIGAMVQHTIYLKDGAATPIDVLNRFHAAATRLAPSLKAKPSVGTIVRVPEFPNKDTAIMVDVIAARPGSSEFKRVPFTAGPKEIVETIRVEPVVFTAGLEAFDFEHRKLAPDIDAQVDAIVDKLNLAATQAGLSIGNMVTHTLYVRKGVDPMRVIQRIHPSIRRYTQDLAKHPPVGGIVIVDGMVNPDFLLEMDAVLAPGKPENHKRVPLQEVSLDVARSVAVDDLVFLSSMPGVDFENKLATPSDVFQQVDIAVKNVHHALQKSQLGIGNMVKHRLYLKKGAGDPAKVRARFYEAVARYAPDFAKNASAETFVIVEGLASPDRLFEVHAIAARP